MAIQMKRSFLTALGLTKEQIDSIMEENGNDIENAKDKAQEKLEAETGKLQTKIDGLQTIVDSIPKPDPNAKNWEEEYNKLKEQLDNSGDGAVQAKLDALQGEFDTYKQNVEAEKVNGAKRETLQKLLQTEGANPKLISLLEKEFDLTKIEIEGEGDKQTIKGWADMLKPVKEQYTDIFGTVGEVGAKPATPPKTDPKDPSPKTLGDALREKYNIKK